MKAIIVSYNAGMFGEFIATKISESNKDFLCDKKSIITQENRFLYPNYLLPIDFDCKNIASGTKWSIDENQISILNKAYQDKVICLPTHWYSTNLSDCMLPAYGIRLYSDDLVIVNLAYCMFWIKSHVYSNNLWKERYQEILNLINSGHKNSKELGKLLEPNNYQNWKFLALRDDDTIRGELDLFYYLIKRYKKYVDWNKKSFNKSDQWNYIDAGKIIYLDPEEINKLEKNINGTLNQEDIKTYSLKNEKLLNEKLGINLNDLQNVKWIEPLYRYISKTITTNNL